MPDTRSGTARRELSGWNDWRGVVLVAGTYIYFLIFAQFGFLKRLDTLGVGASHLKLVMAAMACGGILSSLLAPRISLKNDPAARLRLALAGCAVAALLSTLPLTVAASAAVSALIGVSLGLLTVTLVTNLDMWFVSSSPLWRIGLGTGLGYFVCNVPELFTASPLGIALFVSAVCAAMIVAAGRGREGNNILRAAQFTGKPPSFGLLLACFTALIWLDSAAFFIIQNSPALKAGTWQGDGHLWRTGTVHIIAALASAWLLVHWGTSLTLFCAFASLAGACLVLHNPAHASIAAVLYPVGVSLYSVALVAAPAFLLSTTSREDRAKKTGWIYAVAGWIGSAMGIGMGQNLHRVPTTLIATAALLFVIPWAWRYRKDYLAQVAAVLGTLAAALALQHVLASGSRNGQIPNSQNQVEQGRGIYISEGCIHCHSQYVRPHSSDILLWGPAQNIDAIRREKPPLIGNRRQGPDLSEVGSRRSPLWLRMHFINPRDVSYDSIMPEYAYLFRDDRGEALLAYVSSLNTTGSRKHLKQEVATWTPSDSQKPQWNNAEGQRLFANYCATCHVAGGRAREAWRSSFRRVPPDLASGPLPHLATAETPALRRLRIAKIIKFGIPGTDMAGHEYLPDDEVEALAGWVDRMSASATR